MKEYARRHSKTHTKTKSFPCPLAKKYDCELKVDHKEDAKAHSAIHTGAVRWICTVPMCYKAVSKTPLKHRSILWHTIIHRKHGHLKVLDEHPKPVEKLETAEVSEMAVLNASTPKAAEAADVSDGIAKSEMQDRVIKGDGDGDVSGDEIDEDDVEEGNIEQDDYVHSWVKLERMEEEISGNQIPVSSEYREKTLSINQVYRGKTFITSSRPS